MAAETDAIIRISANGADAASAAIGSVSTAMEGIGRQHNDLVEKFGHRFEHVGLMLFAGEALRASGLGMEARQIIGTLTLALNSLALAGGPAAIAMTAITAAIAAGFGIYEKLAEHHKNVAEGLEKLVAADEKERGTLEESMGKLREYIELGGPHAAAVKNVLDAKMKLQAFIEASELVNAEKQIQAEAALVASEYEQYKALRTREEAQKSLNATSILAIAITQGATAGVSAIIEKYTDLKKKVDDTSKAILDHNTKLQEARFQYDLLKDGSHKTFDQILKDLHDTAEAEKKSSDEERQETLKNLNEKYQASYESFQKTQKANEEMYKQFEEHGKHAFNTINQAQANAFAKMVVEGESFKTATAHIWRDLAEQVIAQIEAMIVKLTALYALEAATGMGSGAAMASPIGKVLGFAQGGSVVVDKPTLFMAGEGGEPEMATFTPMSQLGSSAMPTSGGDGASVQIGTIQTNVYGASNPDQIADQVGLKIMERIRGLGESNFTRAS